MLGRKDKNFYEKLKLFMAGNVDMYANSMIRDCVPQGEYLETLGMGSEKLVILYKDMLLNQKRVLNIRLPDLSQENEKRFIRSTRIMATISDSEILSGRIPPFPLVYDLRESPFYFVCEYCKGSNLRKYIQTQGASLSLKDKLLLFKQIVQGVGLLHSYNVVHRDLKPDNIIITESGQAKLIDFGIAMSGIENVLTRTNAILGTPGYAAPEQMEDAGNVDERADIFALAKICYFMVANDDEFAPENLPVELLMTLPKAWQDDRERRPGNTVEFFQDIIDAFPEFNLGEEKKIIAQDALSVARAFSDFLILCGGNTGKVKKIFNMNLAEWELLMQMAKENVLNFAPIKDETK
jgi:serine/threonine protein kinase